MVEDEDGFECMEINWKFNSHNDDKLTTTMGLNLLFITEENTMGLYSLHSLECVAFLMPFKATERVDL